MDTRDVSGSASWNKGRLMGQKLPLKPKEIWAIRFRLQLGHHTRDPALFNLGFDSTLRGCDLVALRVRDVAQGDRVGPTGSASGAFFNRERQRNRACSRCGVIA